jgi:translation initiation factor 1A
MNRASVPIYLTFNSIRLNVSRWIDQLSLEDLHPAIDRRNILSYKKRGGGPPAAGSAEPMRVRTPNKNEGEMFGIIIQMLGFDRVRVRCEDGNIRVGRIPGRMKKRVWMRVGDTVLLAPWDFQTDEKCDVVYRYRGNELEWLEKRGILKMF